VIPERNTIRWERGEDGIVLLTFDDPAQTANTLNNACRQSITAAVDRLEAECDQITGVIIASAKKTFFAGGDLNRLFGATPERAASFATESRELNGAFRRIETLGRPVVATLAGAALGGGLEVALAAHHRIVVDDPEIELGLPEVTLGLLPGAGGTTRVVRMLGVADALEHVILPGTRHDPRRALDLCLIDQLVSSPEQLPAAAREWISTHPDAAQPWDAPGYVVPGGTPHQQPLAAKLPSIIATLRKNYPCDRDRAPHHALAAAVEGAQVDVNTALEIEGRYFLELMTGQTSKNMIRGGFFDPQRLRRRGRGPDAARFEPARAVVLGAGMMGAGIAHVCARAGMEVVLKDTTLELAEAGRARCGEVFVGEAARGRITAEQADAFLTRITATADPADAAGAELLIEAVFEDPAVKAAALAEIEPHLAADALLASNTSTLPITQLASAVTNGERFIGIHFFSPVHKMPLIEIIKGAGTSDATLERALDVARRLRKTAIVVNDSPGFFTSRVIRAFTNEGLAMLPEGVAPASIEQATLQVGYPTPVLALCDQLGLDLMQRIRRLAVEDPDHALSTDHKALDAIDQMLAAPGRPGRRAGAGFYEYVDGRRQHLWSGLGQTFPPAEPKIPFEDVKERLLFAEAIEAVRCLQEGVIESAAAANVGSLLGIGFPRWTGGVLQYINSYAGGPAGFAERARALADRYGTRFEAPTLLLEKAGRGEQFDDKEQLAVA
jgi:3-hydroxyacyl-CoA dehydrogenase/enoyl-CoA hydratase/3-hydroxybutyryl-CoA epimerase